MKKLLSQDVNIEFDRLYSLIYDLHPTIYIENNTINQTSDQAPLVLKLEDLNSNSLLSNDNNSFHSIELLYLTIYSTNDLNNYINVANLKSFKNLRYIYILCYTSASESDIQSFISNAESPIFILFINAEQE